MRQLISTLRSSSSLSYVGKAPSPQKLYSSSIVSKLCNRIVHHCMTTDSAIAAMPQVKLYQYEPCPFCNKVRAFLDYNNVPYVAIEVNPLSKNEIKFSTYRKVPIAMIDKEQINGSADIISAVEAKIVKESSDRTSMNPDVQMWTKWIDERLIKLLPPNIYRTTAESFQTFEYLTYVSNFTMMQKITAKYVGSIMMYMIGKKLKRKYKVEDERKALYEAVDSWVDAVEKKNTAFHGGSRPDVADLSVFGVLKSLTNFDTFNDVMQNTKVRSWYTAMQNEVGESSRINKP